MASVTPICRGCLGTKNRTFNDVLKYTTLIENVTGITIKPSDGLPEWICSECCALLQKCSGFKSKMLKTHTLLQEYAAKCAPFPLDSLDEELIKYSNVVLNATATQICEYTERSSLRQFEVIEHVKQGPHNRYYGSVPEEQVDVKIEPYFSDYEDNIPLGEFRSTIDKLSDSDFKDLLIDNTEFKTEKNKKKNEGKIKKKIKTRVKRTSTEKTNVKTLRSQTEGIDPKKIRIIDLNPEEQIEAQRLASEKDFCKLKYKCHLCYKGFNYKEKLDNHMTKHSPSRGKFKCKLCYMYLPTVYSYGVHMLIHTRRYECVACGRRMIDKPSIIDHYRSKHEGIVTQYTCHICGKESHNNKTHRGHMRNHHGTAERPKCHLCSKTFINKDSLLEHILIHQGIKNYDCPKCNKKFRTKTQMTQHQLIHSDVKEYYCVECDARFKSAHNLKQHLLKSIKHRDEKTLQFECNKCDKRFESTTRLLHHVAIQHEGIRSHECIQCGARLASQGALSKHMKGHEGVSKRQNHVCHTCGRMFSASSVLQNHMRTHNGERPFVCTRCGRAFAQRTAMYTHIKLVHLKIKRNAKIHPGTLNSIAAENKPICEDYKINTIKNSPSESYVQTDQNVQTDPNVQIDTKSGTSLSKNVQDSKPSEDVPGDTTLITIKSKMIPSGEESWFLWTTN